MKAIVTGAAGFIGSHLCLDLIHSGYEVIGIDALRPYYSRDLKSLRCSNLLEPAGINVYKLDLLNFEALDELVRKFAPTTIFHLAAQPGVRLPISQSEKYIQDNLVVHSNVMKSAVLNQTPNVLYASSSSVYGDSSTPPYSETETNLKPLSLYGSTKLANEILSSSYIKNSKTRTRGLRFFTVYGPWGRPDMAYFRLIASALNHETFKLFGDGALKRDFTFVKDVTQMTVALDLQLSKMPQSYADVVNIGGGAPRSMVDLINCIEENVGKKININYMKPNSDDIETTIASTKNLISLIGMYPRTTLNEGIANAIEWASQDSIRGLLRNWIEA